MTDTPEAKPDDGKVYFDRADPKVHFAMPAHPTVEQQLTFHSQYVETVNQPMYLRNWHAARILVTDWACDVLPDMAVDLKTITDPSAATIIMWVSNQVLTYINGLDTLPKV